MTRPSFSAPRVWIGIHVSKEQAKQSAKFVKWYMSECKTVHSMSRASRNERLNDNKTHAPPAFVYLLFVLRAEMTVPFNYGET